MKKFKTAFALGFTFILLMACGQPQNQQKNNSTTDSSSSSSEDSKDEIKQILFFGNSLTAGYGLDNQNLAFPSLIQQKIDSLKLPYQCINAGLSGETSAGGKDRINWLLKQKVDVFVLELGANDGLRGIEPDATYNNLKAIVDQVKQAYPDCKLVLAGMKIPPSMGEQYFKAFEQVFPKLAQAENMTLVPFLLEGVAGNPKLNQQDAVHPTKDGQVILAKNVWSVLQPLL